MKNKLSETSLRLAFNLEFDDLYLRSGLIKIDKKFDQFLTQNNPEIAISFAALKADLQAFT